MKVFCAGHELDFLKIRALVLESAGCVVQFGDTSEALEAISGNDFDAVVVSFEVADQEYDLIYGALASSVRVVRLGKLVAPSDLIAAVSGPGGTA